MSEVRCTCHLLRPGLDGLTEASCIILQGKAYKVAQAEVPEDEPGTTTYVFKSVSTDDVLSDKAAHLEVIRQVKA